MFVGHCGPGFVAKRFEGSIPLWVLFIAALWLDVVCHREPPWRGLRRGAVAYTHFGARLARPGRFDTCTLYQVFAPVVQRTRIVGLHPNRCGFNSRTAHHFDLQD
jgi:hypothetical protein